MTDDGRYMTDGRRLLTVWVRRSRLQNQEVAAMLGCSRAYLAQIIHGHRRPKLEMLITIERITGVAVKSWADTRRGKLGKRRKPAAKAANVSNAKHAIGVS